MPSGSRRAQISKVVQLIYYVEISLECAVDGLLPSFQEYILVFGTKLTLLLAILITAALLSFEDDYP